MDVTTCASCRRECPLVRRHRWSLSTSGTLAPTSNAPATFVHTFSDVPTGRKSPCRLPGVETPGYYQTSLTGRPARAAAPVQLKHERDARAHSKRTCVVYTAAVPRSHELTHEETHFPQVIGGRRNRGRGRHVACFRQPAEDEDHAGACIPAAQSESTV
jgi:hypothetical protein